VSDVPGGPGGPGRLGARLNAEAHEALVEAMGLCRRADRLRAEVSRMAAVTMAAEGHRSAARPITDHAIAVEELVDLVREAAGLLGQATWFWAQTMSHDASSDPRARWVAGATAAGQGAEQ